MFVGNFILNKSCEFYYDNVTYVVIYKQ